MDISMNIIAVLIVSIRTVLYILSPIPPSPLEREYKIRVWVVVDVFIYVDVFLQMKLLYPRHTYQDEIKRGISFSLRCST